MTNREVIQYMIHTAITERRHLNYSQNIERLQEEKSGWADESSHGPSQRVPARANGPHHFSQEASGEAGDEQLSHSQSRDGRRPTMTYECVSVGLSGACLGGPAPPGHLHAVPHGAQRVEGRTHVQDGELVGLLVDVAVIVVDDVAHLFPAAVHDPVVAVERQLVAEEEEELNNQFNGVSAENANGKETHPIQLRKRALGEYSLALPPNLFKVGPHGHSLEDSVGRETGRSEVR